VITEIVDEPAQIADFIPYLDTAIAEGLVVREKVEAPVYRHIAKQG